MGIIWEACAGKEWCVHIPFDGTKCLSARACIRVIEENAKFFLEIEIAGNRQRIPLANSCVEARWYVFAARACVANFRATPHSLDFDIVLRLCIDVNIGPIHIGECIDIYTQHVRIGFFTVEELTKLGFQHPMSLVPDKAKEQAVAYVETTIRPEALEALHGQFAAMR